MGRVVNYVKTISFFLYQLSRKIKRPFVSCFVISFPKSGRTWMRYFLGTYNSIVTGDSVKIDFEPFNIGYRVFPAIRFSHVGAQTTLSDDEIKKILCKFYNRNVVMLVRDPRDVIVSFYFHMLKRYDKDVVDKEISIHEFIRHDQYGISRIISFMNLIYHERDRFSSFSIFRYEDMQLNPTETFTNILDAVGARIMKEDAVMEAIEQANFNNMKKVERSGVTKDVRLIPIEKNDEESYKVRKGKVGGYVDYLDADDIHYVNKCLKALDPAFGYSL